MVKALTIPPLDRLMCDGEYLVLLDTLGDGSCLLHAIVASTDGNYASMSVREKIALVQSHRKILATHYSDIENYKSLPDCEARTSIIRQSMPKLTEEQATKAAHAQYISYLNGKSQLSISDTNILTDPYKVNIIILTKHVDEKNGFFDGFARTCIPYNPDYATVMVLHSGSLDSGHFETVGIDMPSNGYRVTYFTREFDSWPKSMDAIISAYWSYW
jgi:hypothetical protein